MKINREDKKIKEICHSFFARIKRKELIPIILVGLFMCGLAFWAAFSLRPVTDLSGQKVNATCIRLSWNHTGRCDGYVILRYSKATDKMEEVGRLRSSKTMVYEDDVNGHKRQQYEVAAVRIGKDGKETRSKVSEVTVGGLTGYETIGHRGAMDLAPDDTIVSFERAKKAGYTTFECDMWYTKSGDLFIFHDPTLDKLTGKTGYPSKLSQDNYLMYPILYGKNSDKYPVQYPPDLAEVLKWGKDHDMHMIIHIKVLDIPYDDTVFTKISSLLGKYDMRDNVLFFTSDYKVSELMSRYNIRKGFLTSYTTDVMRRFAISVADRNNCELVIMRYTDRKPLTAKINRYAHEKGILTAVYNIERKDQIRNLINSRTDYWITNRVLLRSDKKKE